MPDPETIIALSSGELPSGVAVVRVSGSLVKSILNSVIGSVPAARTAVLRKIIKPDAADVLDEGLVLFFPGPSSFTGEDCAEFQIHGGKAVVSALLKSLSSFEGVRFAEAGEFIRRAFENGKLDLTAVDGVSDLIASETEQQRLLALEQSQGSLRRLYEGWRGQLVEIRAFIEAELDFTDEEDVPDEVSEEGFRRLVKLEEELAAHLDDGNAGEIIRDGFRVALMGKPNSGKSSLLNALAKRDVAIVTDKAGTTRDVLEVFLDIGGYKVSISDTAGIRDTQDEIEFEGIRRAQARADQSNLVIWLTEKDVTEAPGYSGSTECLTVRSKIDLAPENVDGISVKTGVGVKELMDRIQGKIEECVTIGDGALITRLRYRSSLDEALKCVRKCIGSKDDLIELRAEMLRQAGDHIGRVVGKIDVEDLLDVIFSEFCVGK